MSSKFLLEIVTPDKNFYHDEVKMIIVKTTEGDVGVLHDHEPFVAPLSIGKIRIKQDDKFLTAACSGGFINIDEEKAVIITDSAEWAHEIDVNRANEAKRRADERLKSKSKDVDGIRARAALTRAVNRIKVHETHLDHSNL